MEQYKPTITALSGGGFVIAWETFADTDGTTGIRARVYAEDGTPRGDEFYAHTTHVHRQYDPSITALADGGFVVVWRSQLPNASLNQGVIGQRFAADGTKVGDEFRAFPGILGEFIPNVSSTSDGGFVVTWAELSARQNSSERNFFVTLVSQSFSAGFPVSEESVRTFTTASLLGNDSDPDGDSLTLTSVASTSAMGASVTIDANGVITYDGRSSSQIQALAANKGASDTFTYTISDGKGGTATGIVSVNVVGKNDASVIADPVNATVTEDAQVDASGKLTLTGILGVSDIDIGDAVGFLTTVTAAAGNYGSLTLTADGRYTYSVLNSDVNVQSLGANQTKVDSFTVTAIDGTSKQISFTINGVYDATNTAPVLTDGSNGVLLNYVENDVNFNIGASLSLTDFELAAANDFGGLKLNVKSGDQSNFSPIFTVGTGTYSAVVKARGTEIYHGNTIVADGRTATDDMTITFRAGATLSQVNDVLRSIGFTSYNNAPAEYTSFQWTVWDGNSGDQGLGLNLSSTLTTSLQTTSVNDPAEIWGGDPVTLTEDLRVQDGKLTSFQSITVSDPDSRNDSALDGTITAVGTPWGTLTLDSNRFLTYEVNNNDRRVQALNYNESHVDTFIIRSIDGTNHTLTYTIKGDWYADVNAAPVAVADVYSGDPVIESGLTVAGQPTASGNVLDNDTDPDTYDTRTVTTTGTFDGLYGTLVLYADGSYTYTLDNSRPATQALKDSQQVNEVFNYTIADYEGMTSSSTLTIGVTGSNDSAVIGDPATVTIMEDANVDASGNLTASGTLVISDVDTGEASFRTTVTGVSNPWGTLALAANGSYSYAVSNSDARVQALGAGQTHVDTFRVTATDGTTKDVSFTINGVNESIANAAPVAHNDGDTMRRLGGEIRVNTYTTNDQSQPRVAALNDGGYVIAWQSSGQDGKDNGIYGQRYNASGTKTGDEFLINSNGASYSQETPEVTGLPGGGFVVTWVSDQDGDGKGIYAQRFDANGAKLGTEFQVNTNTALDQIDPSVTSLKDGGFVVTWTGPDGGFTGIFGQRFAADGTKIGTEFQINTITNLVQKGSAVTALANGGFAVKWWSESRLDLGKYHTNEPGLAVQMFDAYGAKIGTEFAIDSYYNTFVGSAGPAYSSITGLADGGFVVTGSSSVNDTWFPDFGGITGQRYSVSGTKLGPPFKINTNGQGNVFDGTRVTSLTDGGFVVTWVSKHIDNDFSIYGQRFLSDGTKSGAEFRINTTMAGVQTMPSITALQGGDFVVTWMSAQDGSGFGVYSQLFATNISTNEDTAKTILASTLLTNDTDANGDVLTITAVSATSAKGAAVSLVNGNVVYNPAGAAVLQTLVAGAQTTDTFTYTISDGKGGTSTATVTMTVTGANDAAIIGDPNKASVTEDQSVFLSRKLMAVGTFAISDVDSSAMFSTTVTGVNTPWGTLRLSQDLDHVGYSYGAYNYSVDNGLAALQALGAGQTHVDTFRVTSADGTTKDVSFTINGTNDAAVIGDPATVTVTEDANVDASGNLLATGTLAISDADTGEASFRTTVTGVSNPWGTLALAANGAYTYSVSNSDSRVQALNAGETHVDTFTVRTFDGTSRTVNFTINGVDEVVTPIAQVSTLDLASLGTSGFRIDGATANDISGYSVSSVGDVNGDGYDDLIVGAYKTDPYGRADAGSSYVVFGKASGFGTVDLAALGTQGFQINGAAAGDYSGRSASSAGDINGDGYDDLIIGAYQADPSGKSRAGSSYVIYGKASGFGTVDLASLGSSGFQINGAASVEYSGVSVSSAGDVNGDGYDDLIVGAYQADPSGRTDAGSSYVVYGKASGFGTVDLAALGTQGFQINGAASVEYSGVSVSSAGDVNGDGYGDIIIGAYNAGPSGKPSAGSSYVVYGKASGFGTVDLAALGTQGFQINGAASVDFSGLSVSSAGDVNGDGYGDILIGASNSDASGMTNSGSSYVVFGKASGFGTVDLAALGTQGFQINGAASFDYSGVSVSSAGDVNGDGYDDIIIGAYQADPSGKTNAGSSYVIYGKASGFGTVDLAALGTQGFHINGAAADDNSGLSVSSAGDINGDGYDDLIVGAYQADPSGRTDAGSSYVIFGGAQYGGSNIAMTVTGSAADESLFGKSGADTIDGSGGNDTIQGGLGADRLTGGMGADVFGYDSRHHGSDTIVDFTSGSDKIAILNALVGTSRTGTLDATGKVGGTGDVLFESVAGNVAGNNASTRLIYDATNHDLYFDADGGNTISGRTLLAHLENGANIAATDIKVVAA